MCHLRCGHSSEISAVKWDSGLWWLSEGDKKEKSTESEEEEKKKKRADRLHIFSCKEIFIGFLYPLNLRCGFMPLKTIFPIKIEVFLTKNCKCHFSIFFTCMRN